MTRGIDIGCYDRQMARLKYPLKFAESDKYTYEELEPAKNDPNQGYICSDEEGDYEE